MSDLRSSEAGIWHFAKYKDDMRTRVTARRWDCWKDRRRRGSRVTCPSWT